MRAFQELEILSKTQDDNALMNLLHTLVPEYKSTVPLKSTNLNVFPFIKERKK